MQYQFSMNESVESVTRKLVALCKTQKAPESRAQMFRLFQLLCSMKFDFYLILSILCNLNELGTPELENNFASLSLARSNSSTDTAEYSYYYSSLDAFKVSFWPHCRYCYRCLRKNRSCSSRYLHL